MQVSTFLVLMATIYLAPHAPKWIGIPAGVLFIIGYVVNKAYS